MPALDTDAAIERLALRVIDTTLPKSEWTHAGHFAAALWLSRNRPDLTTPDEIRQIISAYNTATGTPNTDVDGYHHTITLASMRAAAHCLGKHPPDAPLAVVLKALLASTLGASAWVLTHWSRERLFSVEARRAWVEPDLVLLPF